MIEKATLFHIVLVLLTTLWTSGLWHIIGTSINIIGCCHKMVVLHFLNSKEKMSASIYLSIGLIVTVIDCKCKCK